MLPFLTRDLLWKLPIQVFLSPGGYAHLLIHIDKFFPSSTNPQDSTFPVLTVILIHLFLTILLRYILGQVVSTLLALESYSPDGAALDHRDQQINRRPFFHNVSDAVHHMYRTQGAYLFVKGFGKAAIYSLAHFVVRYLLAGTVFAHGLLRPVAYAAASVLLCNLHLSWTRIIISTRQHPPRSSELQAVQGKRKRLALPAFLYGMALALMYEANGLMEGADDPAGQGHAGTDVRASTEVMAVILLVALRVFGLLPATVALTLAETSLLPEPLETVIPSPTKPRGATITELIDGAGAPSTFSVFTGALTSRGRRQLVWLVEFHLKTCLIGLGLEVLFLVLLGAVLM